MFNQQGKQVVTLSTLGGLVTLAPPISTSEGSSPLCFDVDFLVGAVFTRDGLQVVLNANESHSFVWVKTFTLPNGQIYTLGLDNVGGLWQENVTSSPGTFTQIESVLPGDSGFGTTAFGREYLCLGPGDQPRQYDGISIFDRISQEGPGVKPNVVTAVTSNPNLANITSYSITSNVITVIATNAFTTGETIQLSLPASTGLNGIILYVASASGTQFTADYNSANVASTNVTGTAVPLTNFPIASITQPAAQVIQEQLLWSAAADQTGAGTNITVYYSRTTQDATLANAFSTGLSVYVYLSGLPTPFVDGTYLITSIGRSKWSSNNAFYFTVTATSSEYKKIGPGLFPPFNYGNYQITLATVTLTTPMPGTVTGNSVNISAATPSAWDGSWTIIQAPNSGIFIVTQTSMDASGNATYNITIQSGNAPVVGDLVTVTNTTNGNGIFNVTNALISAVGTGYFEVAFPNYSTAITAAAETGQAEVTGNSFLIDPGPNFVGGPNTASPIFGNDSGTGVIVTLGESLNIAPGTRQCVVLFLTRNGFLTAPSPPTTFTVNSQTVNITVSNIPLGPPDTIARWIAFTEAGANGVPGAYFYTIPVPVNTIINGQPYTFAPTIINDNTSTTGTFSFIDSVLLSSLEIDIVSGNQFNLVELASCVWNINYAGRMFYGLENNKVQNFINLSFNGGYLSAANPQPTGWTADSTYGAGGSLIVSSEGTGNAYLIQQQLGSGSSGPEAIGGMITQSAYQDCFNVAILQPNTPYSARIYARIPAGVTSGNLVLDLATYNSTTEAYGPVLGSITIPFSSMSENVAVFTNTLLTTAQIAVGSLLTQIPSTLLLRLYATNLGAGANVEIDRIEIFPTQNPVNTTNLRVSYVNNPEAFDGVTGNLGVAATNTQPVNGAFVMYDQLYLLKEKSMFSTQDTPGSEPSGWDVHEVSNKCGACGPYAYDVGEEWAVSACRSGFYVFYGRQPIKLSQEIFQVWEAINWTAGSTIWVRNDITKRRILIGVPMATPNQWLPNAPSVPNPTSPNVVLMLNYQGLGDVMALGDGEQMHTTMFGTLMSVDMRRKWTIWQITSPYADFCTRQDGLSEPLFICNGKNTGKIYQLVAGQLSDDGAAINSLYTTYGFTSFEKAQQYPLLGFYRKNYTYWTAAMNGAGNLTVKFLPGNLIPNAPYAPFTLPVIPLSATPADDYERSINVIGTRVFVQLSTNAVGAWWNLNHMTLIGKAAALPLRGNLAQ